MNKVSFIVKIIFVCALITLGAEAKVTLTGFKIISKSEPGFVFFQKKLERFHKQNPDIEIKFDYLAGEAYHNKLKTLTVSGNIPNIMSIWPGKRTTYITDSGKIRDLRDLIKRDNINKEHRDIFLSAQGKNGEVYELGEPLMGFTNIVYVNTKLLDKLGLKHAKTYTELFEQSKILKEAGYRTMALGGKETWTLQSTFFSMLSGRIGGLAWFEKAKTGKVSFEDKPFIDALNFVKQIANNGIMSKKEPSITRQQAMAMFLSSKLAYYMGGIWETGNMRTGAPEGFIEGVKLIPFPHINGQMESDNSTSAALSGGYGISTKSTTEETEAAWRWIKFAMSPKNADLIIAGGDFPIYKNVDVNHLIKEPFSKEISRFASSIDTILPVLDDKMDAEGVDIINKGLQALILGDITSEKLAKNYENWVVKNDSNRK